MREKGDQDRFAAAFPGLAHDPRENLLMATVDAVEMSERRHRRSEAPLARLEMPNDLHRARRAWPPLRAQLGELLPTLFSLGRVAVLADELLQHETCVYLVPQFGECQRLAEQRGRHLVAFWISQ